MKIMKIWKFSASGLLRGAVAAAFAGAMVLGLGLPAKASLLGDTITVDIAGFVDSNIFVDGTQEIQSIQGGTTLENLLFLAETGAGLQTGVSFIDIDATGVNVFFNFGGTVPIIFSNLDWQPPDGPGTITQLNFTLLSAGTLDSFPPALTIQQLGTAFRVSTDCGTIPTVCNFPLSYRVDLTAHVGGEPVPEPDTLALFGIGMLGLMVMMRRRQAA